MSIRPQMSIVFGIDDFHGPLDDEIFDRQIPPPAANLDILTAAYLKDVFMDPRNKEWKWISEFVYYGADTNLGVLGVRILSTRHDSDLVRVLSVFHPEYAEPGKLDLPVLGQNEYCVYTRQLNPLPTFEDIEFQWLWFYPAVVEQHNMWPVLAYRARWLLQQCGIEIDYRRFKAMLVWDWT